MGAGAIALPFTHMHRIHTFCSSTKCVSHILSMCESDELGVPELDANNLSQGMA